MKRIGFIIPKFGAEWIGGLNYYRNLFYALAIQDKALCKAVVIVPRRLRSLARESFGDVEILTTSLVERKSLSHIVRKMILLLCGRDLLLERFLEAHQIDAISHGPALGPRSPIPSIIWIADFQHLHLPQFFSPRDVHQRKCRHLNACKAATLIVLSSDDSKTDLLSLAPSCAAKVRVMRFTPKLADWTPSGITELLNSHCLKPKYIFLPNQFWAHKNHLLVFEAVKYLVRQGYPIHLVCTGAKVDDRNAEHAKCIETALSDPQVGASVSVLGLVPYRDMLTLMFHAHAVINPSLFEGWSSTVEEAKIIGRPLILSNIGIHLEQAGRDALFFNPLSVQECANAIKTAWDRSLVPSSEVDMRARSELRSREFGAVFQCIILEALKIRRYSK
jgi:glycosyltransferase involved in cell wall biosynthesis